LSKTTRVSGGTRGGPPVCCRKPGLDVVSRPNSRMNTLDRLLTENGWRLLAATGWILFSAGVFALVSAANGVLLPHDVRYLGMTSQELCGVNACRVVHFMSHDRVSFGGSIMAIGILYHALAAGPLRAKEAWAWVVFAVSGAVGFASFLAYLGYGY